MKAHCTPEYVTDETTRTLAGGTATRHVGFGLLVFTFTGLLACEGVDQGESAASTAEVDQKMLVPSDPPPAGVVNIVSLPYMGGGARKYISDEYVGQSSLRADKLVPGTKERFRFIPNEDGYTYTLESVTSGKQVFTPTDRMSTKSVKPLIANYPPHNYGPCYGGCHGREKVDSNKWYVRKQPDGTYRFYSALLVGGWVTQSDTSIWAAGSYYTTPYQIVPAQ